MDHIHDEDFFSEIIAFEFVLTKITSEQIKRGFLSGTRIALCFLLLRHKWRAEIEKTFDKVKLGVVPNKIGIVYLIRWSCF